MEERPVDISEFCARISDYLREVQAGGVIRLTRHGREIAQVVPPDYAQPTEQHAARQVLDSLRKTAVLNDVLSPIGESWEASHKDM